jgi:ribosome-binding protein aMBF1 (putative translation factor)
MKRKMKLGRFEEWLKKELKDPKFRRGYEQEKRGVFLSYRILTLREKLGWSQKVLAERMGTSQQAVARLESGEYEGFTLKTLEKVAEALGAELIVDLRGPARKPAM